MKDKNKKMNIIQYSKSMDKNLRMINKNKNLNELLQEMNNINNNILRYKQIENLIKYTTTKGFDNKSKENNNTEKFGLLEDMKLLQKRLYKTKKTPTNENNNTNIKIHKNNFKDVMEDIFGKRDAQQKRRYYPKYKAKLKHLKNLHDMNMNLSEKIIKKENIGNQTSNKNICVTERNINNYGSKKSLVRNNTIENEKNTKYNYMNYASNCVKYKHPQFYLLNLSNINKKQLPPIRTKKLKVVDLFNKNNTSFKSSDKKKNKFEKYMIALQMAGIAKFKVNE